MKLCTWPCLHMQAKCNRIPKYSHMAYVFIIVEVFTYPNVSIKMPKASHVGFNCYCYLVSASKATNYSPIEYHKSNATFVKLVTNDHLHLWQSVLPTSCLLLKHLVEKGLHHVWCSWIPYWLCEMTFQLFFYNTSLASLKLCCNWSNCRKLHFLLCHLPKAPRSSWRYKINHQHGWHENHKLQF